MAFKSRRNLVITGVFLVNSLLFAKEDTLRLQQGVDGYEGSISTYLKTRDRSVNFISGQVDEGIDNDESNVYQSEHLSLQRNC